ncbi:Fur family transcriptional regulator [Nesterenkonia aurantiaca]|uniref:Fur family ferric uptake transcriptional regulator n=1 Tax=Nesterenkonia aurantiaca TaxID=1436010 RepID=A0A4R7G4W3_9MICC|nr:Fur family transcriptional regulator [Nesterenkonia aurantiaca]TDS86381.1 Fur family ferric uptake transcriptional regulator [Nesterenkonia aurantiaca]
MTSSDWPARLRERGLRMTRQRLAVLEAVSAAPHRPAEAVHAAVRAQLPEITVQSVYTVLHDLTARELLRRFDPPGSPACYETRTHDNHHHAICTRCGRIEDVECVHGEAPCLQAPPSLQMQIQIADVVFRGICRTCTDTEQGSEELVGSGSAEA